MSVSPRGPTPQGKAEMKLRILAVISLVLAACAPPPRVPGYDGETRGEQCLASGKCVVLEVENRGSNGAKIYLNGARFGFVGALHSDTLYIPRSMLDGFGCATLLVSLMAGPTATTGRECMSGGESWKLVINPMLQRSTLTRSRA
jgi:hypothetical protein